MKHNALEGFRILNTRPIDQTEPLNQSIVALGGQVITCPALTIAPLSTSWETEAPSPLNFNYIIFISPNAVKYYFERVSSKTWPRSVTTIALGPGTAAALLEEQIVAVQPQESHTESLLQLACLQAPKQRKILIIKGAGGRELLCNTLLERGAVVQTLTVYTRTMPTISPSFLQEIWRDNRIDIILFTSQQGMEQLFALFGQSAQTWLQSKPCLVISQRLADIARQMGIKKIFIAAPNQLTQGLFEACETLKLEKQGTST